MRIIRLTLLSMVLGLTPILPFLLPHQAAGILPRSTNAVGTSPSAHSGIIAFTTAEVAVQIDLNMDGDKSDKIIRYYNVATGAVTNTGVIGDYPSVFGNLIVSTAPGGIISYYSITSATTTSPGLVGEGAKIFGDSIVFTGFDQKIRIYHISTGVSENTDVFGSNPSASGTIVAFSTSEGLVNFDLNGDGVTDPFTSVARYYDSGSGSMVNTGALADSVSMYGSVIAFDYALNAPVRFYNTSSGLTIDTGTVGLRPSVYGDRIVMENGTIRMYEVSTGTSTDTGIDGNAPSAHKNLVAFETDENIVNKDLNGDHVIKDVVIRYFELPLRDVSIVSISLPGNRIVEPNISINLTIANYGSTRETLDVTVLWNTTVVVTIEGISLDPQASTTLEVNWNTTGLPNSAYVISAKTNVLPGEAETLNNSLALDPVRKCALQGDVNGDGTVNIIDLAGVGRAFGSTFPGPGYDPAADLNGDGTINILDLVIVALNFGRSC